MNSAQLPTLTEKYLRIPLDQLQESKTNPRRHFDKTADAELAASIKAQGVVEPVIVRPHPGGKDYELVAGARRFRQSKVAGVADIPAIVRNYTDAQAMEVQIIENLQRKDVHPYDEAFGFKALLDQRENGKPRYDVPAIAARVGKSVSYVYMRLKLTDLIKEAQEVFLEGKIDAGHAEKIARLQPKQQAQALKECTQNNLSVRQLADWIDRNVHLDLVKAPFDPKDPALVLSAKACTTCPKRTGTQPDLFADISKADTCTDPGCFNAKVNVHFQQREATLAGEGLKIIRVTSNHYSTKKGVVPLANLTRAGNTKCDDLGAALIVEGPDCGKDVRICTNEKCKKHHPQAPRSNSARPNPGRSSPSSNTPIQREHINTIKTQARQEHDADEIVTPKAIRTVLQAFKKKPKLLLTELKILTIKMMESYLFDDVTDEALAALCVHHGLKAGDVDRIDMEKIVERCKKPEQVMAWLYSLVIANAASYPDNGTFDVLAKARGVDTKKLRAEVLAQVKAKDTALDKANKKPKASKPKLQTSAKPVALQVAEKLDNLGNKVAKATTKKAKKKATRAKP